MGKRNMEFFPKWVKQILCCILFVSNAFATSTVDKESVETVCGDDSPLTPPQPLVQRKKGSQLSIHVIGVFDVHEGSRCHLLKPGGMEQVMMTIGILENRLMHVANSNTSQIGFQIYDTCSNTSTALLNVIHALMEIKASKSSCVNQHYIGVLGPKNPDIQHEIGSFLRSMNIPYFPLVTRSLREEIKALTEVLLDLKWKVVALFTSTESLLEEFREEANMRDICIASTISIPRNEKSKSFLQMVFHDITESGIQVAIVLGSGINLRSLYEAAVFANSSIQYWLLAGVGTVDSVRAILFGPDHPVIVFKSTSSVSRFDSRLLETYEFGSKIQQLKLVPSYIEYMNSCLKNTSSNDSRCEEHHLKARNPEWSLLAASLDTLLRDALKTGILSNETSSDEHNVSEEANHTSEIEIWTYQHAIGKFSKHKELQVGHYSQGKLMWDKKRLNVFRFMGSGWFKIPEYQCQRNCHEICSNFVNISVDSDLENIYNRIFHWKYETWVTVLLTGSCVGIAIALFIAVYLIVKSCKDDFEDGTQISNVMLLIAVVFSYSCTVLFMFHRDNGTCTRRVTIIGIAYVSMLAPLLSRCFLLIAAEMDGIHGHVSGFLQSILCLFISGVQIAMAAYYWLMYADTKSPKFKCAINMKQTLAYLSYSMILSFTWLVASPFSARCRRNNREGLLLHFGSIAVCIVWLIWYLMFFLLHTRWNEFTICFGLVSTATAILLVIFLPKVYRMVVASAAKKHGQVSMQPVIFASSSSRSPNLSIYESVNHGYNPDKDGYLADVFRDEEESPGPRKMTHL